MELKKAMKIKSFYDTYAHLSVLLHKCQSCYDQGYRCVYNVFVCVFQVYVLCTSVYHVYVLCVCTTKCTVCLFTSEYTLKYTDNSQYYSMVAMLNAVEAYCTGVDWQLLCFDFFPA